MTDQPTLQDFSVLNTHVEKSQNDYDLKSKSTAFSYFVLDLMFNLQEDEIEDVITDTNYLKEKEKSSGHDRGIDGIYIDNSVQPSNVHLFNFKYTEQFKKVSNNFPSSEVDKILSFLSSLMIQDESMRSTVNPFLYSKIEEIWELFKTENPVFKIHLCSNHAKGLEKGEGERFDKDLKKYSNISFEHHLLPDLVLRITHQGRKKINAKIRAIDKSFFEKSDGDIRALIANFDAKDILRVVSSDDDFRDDAEPEDYSKLSVLGITEDAFEDNVRIYLKLRSKINRNIKETALSDDANRFFYFNNGITLTCDRFSYATRRSPLIEIENLQVVNGSQTIHALSEAYSEDKEKFDDIELLCRIYETGNDSLTTSIAEYTNSQNPVKSRDIRSNDYVQKKLEKEFSSKGYFYERKKGQYSKEIKSRRIDAEKAGQVLMAFYNEMPSEAKDKKILIFGDKYEDVFNDDINADKVLLALELFDNVENEKNEKKKQFAEEKINYDEESYILHASYYILYLLSKIAEMNEIEKRHANIDMIWSYYDSAIDIVRKSIGREKEDLKGYKENYTHRVFFKSNKPKKHIEDILLEMKKEAS